jgi:L-amino acid N-acyltransferase YncA
MTRFLLSILALLGVVAQAAPAVARVEGVGVGVVAAQAVAARAVAACVAEVTAPVRPAIAPQRIERACLASAVRLVPVAPTVRIGSDRSAQ